MLLGAFVLSIFSLASRSLLYATAILLFGFLLVFTGLGVLLLQNWARIATIVLAALGVIYSIPLLMSIAYGNVSFSLSFLISAGIPIISILTLWYFLKLKSLFHKEQPHDASPQENF